MTPLSACSQTELAIIHTWSLNSHTIVSTIRNDLVNTSTVVSGIRQDVVDTRAVRYRSPANLAKSQDGADGKNQSVSVACASSIAG